MSDHNETTEHAYLVVRMFGIAATPELHLGYLIAHRDIRVEVRR